VDDQLTTMPDAGSSRRVRGTALHHERSAMSHSIPGRRDERHPVGLLIVIGLHVLVALMMLSAKLSVDAPPAAQAALTNLAEPRPRQAPSHDLPDVPATSLRQLVAPIPDVVVDREAIEAAPVAAPLGPVQTRAAAPAPAPGPALSGMAGNDNGTAPPVRVEAHDTRVYADAPQCQPVYPQAARTMHVAGTTRLRFTVDAAGHIVDVRLLRRSGQMSENFLLDRTAMDALSHCPVIMGNDESGNPVAGTTDVDYIWRLY
jgi:TonB family protein